MDKNQKLVNAYKAKEKQSYKMNWIFIRTKPGNKMGRIIENQRFEDIVKQRDECIKQGYICSKIGKWKRR